MARTIAAAALLVGAVSGCTAEPTPTPTPTGAAAINEHVEETLEEHDPHHGLRAVLVLEHGESVYERYVESDAEDYWDVRSVTKSVVGTLIGIAIDRGLIQDVSTTLGDLLPRWAEYLTPETSAIPLSAVLTHTANFADQNEAQAAGVWSSPDTIGTILTDRARRGAGDGAFGYSDAGSHILSAVVAEASGMPVLEFARESLFDHLGIVSLPAFEPIVPGAPEDDEALVRAYNDADFAWPQDHEGVHNGYAGVRLRPPDLARLGQLYLDRGRWDDEQLVSESWIEQATAPLVEPYRGLTDHYGFQWWVAADEGYFCALGLGGTAVVVDPTREIVVVVASQFDVDQETEGMLVGNARELAEAILGEFAAND